MITTEFASECLEEFEILISNIHNKTAYEYLQKYITQQDKLTATVKRYFELKEKGIRSLEDTNEHLELLKQIKEMVGIDNDKK